MHKYHEQVRSAILDAEPHTREDAWNRATKISPEISYADLMESIRKLVDDGEIVMYGRNYDVKYEKVADKPAESDVKEEEKGKSESEKEDESEEDGEDPASVDTDGLVQDDGDERDLDAAIKESLENAKPNTK